VSTKPGERQAGHAFIIFLKYSVVVANLFTLLLAGGDRRALVSETAGIAAVANALLTHGKPGEKPSMSGRRLKAGMLFVALIAFGAAATIAAAGPGTRAGHASWFVGIWNRNFHHSQHGAAVNDRSWSGDLGIYRFAFRGA
jgi:hypothetical protein